MRHVAFSLVLLFGLLVACQSAEESKPAYPENEIPVNTESDEALQAFVSGLEWYDQGYPQKARPLFAEALSLDPDFVSAQMYRTFTAQSAEDWAENRDKFFSMQEKANEGEKIMIEQLKSGVADNTEEALMYSKQLVEKYPQSARAWDNLAGNYQSMDEIGKARESWMKALEVTPDFLPAVSGLGFSYMFYSPKDLEKGQSYMEKAVTLAPESSRAYIGLGDSYRAQGDLEQALANYTKAAELDPEDQAAFSKAGHANTFLGNMDEARKNYQEARAVSEFGIAAYGSEAYTYLYEGDRAEAISFMIEAVETIHGMDIPESNKLFAKRNLMANAATIAMHHGDSELLHEIVDEMRPLTAQMKEQVKAPFFSANMDADMHFWDAMIAATSGNYEEAATLSELIKEDMASSGDPDKLDRYHRIHAYVNFQMENYDQALEHMAELDQDDVYNKYWMAKSYKMKGEDDKAMALFEEIVNDNFNSVAYALILAESQQMVAAAD